MFYRRLSNKVNTVWEQNCSILEILRALIFKLDSRSLGMDDFGFDDFSDKMLGGFPTSVFRYTSLDHHVPVTVGVGGQKNASHIGSTSYATKHDMALVKECEVIQNNLQQTTLWSPSVSPSPSVIK